MWEQKNAAHTASVGIYRSYGTETFYYLVFYQDSVLKGRKDVVKTNIFIFLSAWTPAACEKREKP